MGKKRILREVEYHTYHKYNNKKSLADDLPLINLYNFSSFNPLTVIRNIIPY